MANLSNINNKFIVADVATATRVSIGITTTNNLLTLFGTGAGNATLQIEGEGGADPYINFLANNAQHWSLGIDDSDSDKFKLSEHSALGTNDYFVVDTSGNVGIGTDSPDYKLDVYNSSTSSVVVAKFGAALYGTANNTYIEIGTQYADGGSRIGNNNTTGNASSLLFETMTTTSGVYAERMRIDSSGNINIGTGAASDTYVRIYNASTGDITAGYQIYNGSNLDLNIYTNPLFGNSTLLSREALAIRTGGSQTMLIDSSGNVGIGVTPFTNNLTNGRGVDIKNNAGLIGYANAMYISSNVYYNSGWKYKSTGTAALLQVGSTSGTVTLRQAASGNINQAVSFTQTLTIDNSGNVGIGTDSPATPLNVAGNLLISTTVVDGQEDRFKVVGGGAGDGATVTVHDANETAVITMTGVNGRIQASQGIFGTAFALTSVGFATLGSTSSSVPIAIAIDGDASTASIFVSTTKNVGINANSPRDKLTVFTAGSSEEEIGLRLVNPIGFTNAGSGASIIFAQDRSQAENIPMAKIRSSQSAGASSCCGDLIFSTSHTSLGGMIDRAQITSGGIFQVNPGNTVNGGIVNGFRAAISVGQSAVAITNQAQYGGLAMIWMNYAGNIAYDLVSYSLSKATVLSSQQISGGPAARVYTSVSGVLKATMTGSDTYSFYVSEIRNAMN